MWYFIFIVIVLYLYGTRTYNYWKARSVKHDPPLPFLGNNRRQFFQKASIAMLATEVYNKYSDEKVVGFYRGTQPELVIRDPEIAKRVVITDFHHFYAKGLIPHKTVVEPLLKNLFFADGDLWRILRQHFSPAFSIAKLKAMFPIITERAKKLQIITEEVSNFDSYDVRELMARYTTDFIGACAFGINMDSLNNENSEFRRLGKRIFHRTFRDAIISAIKIMFPELCKHLYFLDPELEQSMTYLVQSVMKERNYKPAGKNDFIDLMLELKEKGTIISNLNETPRRMEVEITDLLITAQLFVFFGAGFETSSTTSAFLLHQLAYNPDYQSRIQEEIDQVLNRHNNEITYDAVYEMKNLEKAFNEAMRMYPPVAYIIRMCTSPKYTFPEMGLSINEGVKVIIPIQAIHNDEKYFKNPEIFDPERFNTGTKEFKNVFLPFGDGPRACVDSGITVRYQEIAEQGEMNYTYFFHKHWFTNTVGRHCVAAHMMYIRARLGQMQSLAGIAAVLQKFTVVPAECTVRNPKPEPTATVSESFEGGLPLKIKKRICN